MSNHNIASFTGLLGARVTHAPVRFAGRNVIDVRTVKHTYTEACKVERAITELSLAIYTIQASAQASKTLAKLEARLERERAKYLEVLKTLNIDDLAAIFPTRLPEQLQAILDGEVLLTDPDRSTQEVFATPVSAGA
jgi:hypothetical protein